MMLRLIVSTLFLASCTSGSDTSDTGALDGSSCTTTLDTSVAAHSGTGRLCPPSWSDVPASAAQCGASAPIERDRTGMCGGDLVYLSDCELHGFACYYDSTTQQLVGLVAWDDTPTYCDRTSSCISAGVLPEDVRCRSDGVYDPCRDAVLSPDAATMMDASGDM